MVFHASVVFNTRMVFYKVWYCTLLRGVDYIKAELLAGTEHEHLLRELDEMQALPMLPDSERRMLEKAGGKKKADAASDKSGGESNDDEPSSGDDGKARLSRAGRRKRKTGTFLVLCSEKKIPGKSAQ